MNYEADFNPADFEHREAADKSVYVKFYMRPTLNQSKSDAEGRPIFDDREYLEIRTPGNQTNIINRPVSDMDRQRFRRAYQQFKAGDEEQLTGTPLSEVPWITRSMVEELIHVRIRTLEHLANVNDDVCGRIPGLYALKDRAKAALDKAAGDAPFIAMQAKNEELVNELATLKQALAEQAALLKKLNAEKSGQKG